MPREGSSYRRGYGPEHRKRRERALRTLKPGTQCRRCGAAMFAWQELDFGHGAVPAYANGEADELEHASCNRSAGALDRASRARRARLPEW